MFILFGWGKKSKQWKVFLDGIEAVLVCTYSYFWIFFLPVALSRSWSLLYPLEDGKITEDMLKYSEVKKIFPEKTPELGLFSSYGLFIIPAFIILLTILSGSILEKVSPVKALSNEVNSEFANNSQIEIITTPYTKADVDLFLKKGIAFTDIYDISKNSDSVVYDYLLSKIIDEKMKKAATTLQEASLNFPSIEESFDENGEIILKSFYKDYDMNKSRANHIVNYYNAASDIKTKGKADEKTKLIKRTVNGKNFTINLLPSGKIQEFKIV